MGDKPKDKTEKKEENTEKSLYPWVMKWFILKSWTMTLFDKLNFIKFIKYINII